MFDIYELSSKDIIGVEFYTTAITPGQYNGTRGANMGACGDNDHLDEGLIILWQRVEGTVGVRRLLRTTL